MTKTELFMPKAAQMDHSGPGIKCQSDPVQNRVFSTKVCVSTMLVQRPLSFPLPERDLQKKLKVLAEVASNSKAFVPCKLFFLKSSVRDSQGH